MTDAGHTPATPFRYVTDWKAMLPESAAAIREFWRSEGALNDDAQIEERLKQVVMHACTEDGDVAAVCTAIPMTPPAFGQPVYYYRSFVGKRWRSTRLVERLLRRAQAFLEEFAIANDYPCIGILLELENTRFREKGRMPVWPHTHFVYVGVSKRGLESRVYYFKGARLKNPA